MTQDDRQSVPTETEVASSEDAVAGLAMVKARLACCTREEQVAFWEAVGRCFGSGKAPEVRGS
ncbi:hypothetical protein [Methylobacterium sp. J-076]|uniref:hypothetical protein n=1 Tax=Methylobacterium sp. J-076 TaxID=2836655 RepID=UPI001FB903B1|nr:hypothetical protein [Methylobacterium sp. J-076]MCJ2015410.1 hypothetical protein [Methylobacterium sp. J-076]